MVDNEEQSPSFFRRRLSSATTAWRQKPKVEDVDDSKGPLGLRLLHASPEPLIDLIFVHGLRGGSVKTWRKGNDPALFWPREWLPLEPEFYNVNVHSFGYESDWGSSKPSILNVHDFGRALHEEIRSPLVLVAHSMGGLVIKKAFILAQLDDNRDIAERIKCLFFLATPHRGSDFAALLNRILKVSSVTGMASSREYVNDIKAGSTSSQIINEDFGKYAENLLIYSFYETLPTNLGVTSALVVDKNSAVLGESSVVILTSYSRILKRYAYPTDMKTYAPATGIGYKNERVQYLNANHRDICKFTSLEDSNYVTLKNCLATAVDSLLQDVYTSTLEKDNAKLRAIQSFLGITHAGGTDEHQEKLEGSCQWIEQRPDFQQWITPPTELKQSPSIYWVTANPGAGKTVLAAHIVSQFQEYRLPHASFFFQFGKKTTQSLAAALRSIAYDMAKSNTAVRDLLFKLQEDGMTMDHDDARAIWAKVFRAGIFQIPMFATQYWVIDAIDECVKHADFFALLKGCRAQFPFRIFITSRKLADMQKLVRQLGGFTTSTVEIPIADTMADIRLFVQNRIDMLPIDGDDEKAEIAQQILTKSDGSFLWVRLVMEELEGVYGYESILQVLHSIPEGMVPYYQRTVSEMAKNKREKHIAQAILLWVVSAARPLTTSELSRALKLDINVHLPSVKTAIEGLCGHMVYVDEQTDLVQLVHSTAREFLLSSECGEFGVDKHKAHERAALTCLRLLCTPEMQPPRVRRLLDHRRPERPISVLLEYAITHFSDHVFGASAESDELLVAVDKFSTITILSWIEKVVVRKDLHRLIRTARNLKGYLDRRPKYLSPLNRHVRNIDSWATDLSRLATKFGSALTSYPRSIYFLVPPLCPTESAVYQQFGRAPDGLVLSGFHSQHWDDCIATINFEDESASSTACGNNLIAVGYESGNISFYNHRSCEKDLTIKDSLPVSLVYFDPLGSFVVSCTRRFVSLWDLEGNLQWKSRLRSRCIAISSTSDILLAITEQGRVFRMDVASGKVLEDHSYPFQPIDADGEQNKAPIGATISPGLELVALVYRNAPVCVWELQTNSFVSWAVDDTPRSPKQVLFNPNPEIGLLLVAYDVGQLGLFDSWSGSLVLMREADQDAILNSVACSADGRSLATVNNMGDLRIWDYESLTILYQVQTPNVAHRILEFTSEAFSLVDVVEHQMRIWSPSALVRKTVEEEASTSEPMALLPVKEGQFETYQASKIRSTAAHPSLPLLFAGNFNGDILVYSSKEGQLTGALYSHGDAIVKCIAISGQAIASSDNNGAVQVWLIDVSEPASVRTERLLIKRSFPSAVCQLIFDSSGEYLLISTQEADYVYHCSTGVLVGRKDVPAGSRSTWKWLARSGQGNEQEFMLFADHKLATYSAGRFPTRIEVADVILDYSVEEGYAESRVDSVAFHAETRSLILATRQQCGFISNSTVNIFRLPASVTTTITLQPVMTLAADFCLHFLGIGSDDKLVFLNKSSWVCTVRLKDLQHRQYSRHFFVPNEYVTTSNDVLPIQTVDGDVVFTLYDKVAVIKNGLKYGETLAL
ncbi:NACHT and WD domain protein [Coniochaeta sp. 2T2.1]|nr:NACHT and WD domain protein [Coniochaeta sp. 2T2.1]